MCIIVLLVSAGLMVSWQDTSRGRNHAARDTSHDKYWQHAPQRGASSDQDTSQISVVAMVAFVRGKNSEFQHCVL